MSATATPRKPLTSATWADVFGPGLSRETIVEKGWHWRQLSDLEHELAETSGLTIEQARAIVGAISSGCPVELTYELPRQSGCGQTEYARTRAMVNLTRLGNPRMDNYNLSVRQWGGSTTIGLCHVVDVTVPQAEYTFETREAPAV